MADHRTDHRPRAAAAALALALALPSAALAFGLGAHSRQLFMVRTYSSEVPSAAADESSFVRIGVILPPRSKVIKVQAYMDDEDHGDSVGAWSDCDLDTGLCELGDARVERLRRRDSATETVVTADFWNTHPEAARYAKLRVTFMPVGNIRKTYRPRECILRVRCGFGGWMDADFLHEEDAEGVAAPGDDGQ